MNRVELKNGIEFTSVINIVDWSLDNRFLFLGLDGDDFIIVNKDEVRTIKSW